MEIRPISDKKGLGEFIRLPWKIYRNDPNWVPPLIAERKNFFDPSKNPFYRHAEVRLFGLYDKDKIIGRISAVINQNYNDFHQEKAGFFGCFECINNQEAANQLFGAAERFIIEQGMTVIYGPASFSSNEEFGLLVEGFDSPPVILMPYNPKYYSGLIEGFGFQKAKDLYALYVDDSGGVPERLVRGTELILKRGNFTIRPFRKNKYDEDIDIVKRIYNAAWEKNWGFVPMTEEEFDQLAKEMKSVLDPDIIFFAEHLGKPVGFSLSLPDLNQALIKVRNGRLFPFGLLKLFWHSRFRKIHRIRVITFGVLKEYRNLGLDVALNYHNFVDGMKKGYNWAEMSWILEDNIAIVRPIERLGGKIYKTYRIYEKPIS